MGVRYSVHVVQDNELPLGSTRVLVELVEGDPLLIMTESAWRRDWLPPKNRVDLQRMLESDDTLVLKEVVVDKDRAS